MSKRATNHRPSLLQQAGTDVCPEQRSAERHVCQTRNQLRMLVKPSFRASEVTVRDPSCAGMGFWCKVALKVGGTVAFLWKIGPARRHRILLATIGHVT